MTENPSFGKEKSRVYSGISEEQDTQVIRHLVFDLEKRFGDFPDVNEYINGIKQKIQYLQENNIDIPPALIKILEGLPERTVILQKTIEEILSI